MDQNIPVFIHNMFKKMREYPAGELPFSISEFYCKSKGKEFYSFMTKKMNDAMETALIEYVESHEDISLEDVKNAFLHMEHYEWGLSGITNE